MIKQILKNIIPNSLLMSYHKGLALLAAFVYRYPSEKLIVIGVTGTNGKSTTVNIMSDLLEGAGFKVGITSTIHFKIAGKIIVNKKKMSMLGRFQSQKLLSQMVKAGCEYAIVETTSQGIEQFRHIGINYDVVLFTNLTPEHIEAHGGFENYKNAKGKLFKHLMTKKHKVINGKKVEKAIVVNGDDSNANYFLNFNADKKIVFGIESKENKGGMAFDLKASEIQYNKNTEFNVDGVLYSMQLLGRFNIYNALAALSVVSYLGVETDSLQATLAKIKGVPGRMETIDEGQDFKVIVDYAYEPAALTEVFKLLEIIKHNKIIHVLGSCGGGRDIARRSILGKLSAKNADYVIVTNEDPYTDDPMEIINDVAKGAQNNNKVENKDLFKIEDRKEAIDYALHLAKEGDIVLITGKGSEPVMSIGTKLIPWDDRKVTRELLQNLKVR